MTLKVFAPDGTPLGSATAPAAGADALLQTVQVPGQIADNGSGPKTYTVTVGGTNGTTGNYSLKVVLNAALESESLGGTSDDTLATAQDVNGSWVLFQSAANSGQQPARAAVLGDVSASDPVDTYKVTLSAGQTTTVALTILNGGNAQVALLDTAGNTLALGASDLANNVSQLINNFVVNKTGTYYLQVTGTAKYSLLVTRSTAFDAEGNDSIAAAQDLTTPEVAARRWALGALAVQTSTFVSPGSGGLGAPAGAVFGPDGNLYIASQATNSILRFDGKTGAFLDTFVASNSGGLISPIHMVFGPDGNLYVTSIFSSSVLRYNGSTGDFIDNFVAPGTGGLTGGAGLTFGPDGNLYVASLWSNAILRYDGTSGASLGDFVPYGLGGLSTPLGLTFGPDGNLYVGNRDTNSVLRYDGTTGAFLDTFAAAPGMYSPHGLAFGPDGNLYVSGEFDGHVYCFDGTTGALKDVVMSVAHPVGLTFDARGALYVSDNANASVLRYGLTPDFYKITTDGNKTIEVETSTPAGGAGQFVNALDPALRLYDAAGKRRGPERQRGGRRSQRQIELQGAEERWR